MSLKTLFHKYWIEIIVFGIIWTIFVQDLAPSYTWINTNSDGVHLTFASKYLFLAHKTSAPLYLLLGHFFQMIPIGTDFWRMGLMSVLGSVGITIFIYLTIKQLLPAPMSDNKKRLYALIGVLVYGGSALALSQTIIVKYYTLVTMMCVGAYYFSLKSKWSTSALMLGLGLALHHLIGISLIPLMIFNKELRKPKQLLIIASGLLFYLYFPISIKIFHSPNIWGNESVSSFFGDNLSTMVMLIGGLSIWDLPKRILDTIGVLGISLGFGFIIITWYLIKEKVLKNQLAWLFLLSPLYFMSDLAIQTYVYMLPAVSFGAIIVGYQLSKAKPVVFYTTVLVAGGLLAFNANYFDIGKNLDPNLSATKFYTQELPKIPDGQILMAQYGWEWAMIFPYDKNENRNIIPVDIDTLNSPIYQEQLKQQGIKFNDNFDKDISKRQAFIATSIVSLNENVWTTIPSEPQTYGSNVVRARDYPNLLNKNPTEPPAQWHWKPEFPYSIITGSNEITRWTFITYSTKNIRFFALIVTYSLIIYWFILKLIDRRKVNEITKRNISY